MAISDELLYEYALVRYVPRVDREEFVNIGLVMMCKRRKWLRGEIRLDASRLQAFDPNCNLQALGEQASLFSCGDVPSGDLPVEEKYRWLTAVKSAVLQVSPSHPGLISGSTYENSEDPAQIDSDLDREFNRLLRELVM